MSLPVRSEHASAVHTALGRGRAHFLAHALAHERTSRGGKGMDGRPPPPHRFHPPNAALDDSPRPVCAEHFSRTRPPHVLVTSCFKPSGIMYKFIADLLEASRAWAWRRVCTARACVRAGPPS